MENPSPASLKIVDNTRPCLGQDDADCVAAVEASTDQDPTPEKVRTVVTITPPQSDAGLTHYAIYWGSRACGEGKNTERINAHIRNVDVGGPLTSELTDE